MVLFKDIWWYLVALYLKDILLICVNWILICAVNQVRNGRQFIRLMFAVL